jgi:hypothetical protein
MFDAPTSGLNGAGMHAACIAGGTFGVAVMLA